MESKMKNRSRAGDSLTPIENGNHEKDTSLYGEMSPSKSRLANGEQEVDLDEELLKSGKNKKNILEKRRKDRTKSLVKQMADLIPPDWVAPSKLTTMNVVLENVVNYVTEIKQQNQLMLAGNAESVQNDEITRLKALVANLTEENERLENCLKQGGVNMETWKAKAYHSSSNSFSSLSTKTDSVFTEASEKRRSRSRNKVSTHLQQMGSAVLQNVNSTDSAPAINTDTLNMPSLMAGNFMLPGNTPVPPGTPFISPSGTLRIAEENMSSTSVSGMASAPATPMVNLGTNALTAVTQSVDITQPRMAIGQPPVTNASPPKSVPISTVTNQASGSQAANTVGNIQVNSSQPLGQGIIITQTGQVIVLNEQGVPVNQYAAGPNFEIPFLQRPPKPANAMNSLPNGQPTDENLGMNASGQIPVTMTQGPQPVVSQGPPVVPVSQTLPTGPQAPTMGPQGQQAMNPPLAIPGPGGLLQVNTRPSHPNQLPSALILPNGQLIPVVTQPHLMVQGQNPPGLLMTANSQPAPPMNYPQSQQEIGQAVVSTPAPVFSNGLLMTTAAAMTHPTTSVNTVLSAPNAAAVTTSTMFQPAVAAGVSNVTTANNSQPVQGVHGGGPQPPGGAANTAMLPPTVAVSTTTTHTPDNTVAVSGSSTTNVVAGVNSQGMIVLTLPPGGLGQQGIILDPNSLVVQGGARAKAGQRILMPKPANFETTPTKKSAKSKKKTGSEKPDSDVLGSGLWNTQLMSGVSDGLAVVTTSSVQTGPANTPKKKKTKKPSIEKKDDTATDILAQATESIFSDISPTISGLHLDDENPLHIDTSMTEREEDPGNQNSSVMNAGSLTKDATATGPVPGVSTQAKVQLVTSPVTKPGGHLKVAQPPCLVSQVKVVDDSSTKAGKVKDSKKLAASSETTTTSEGMSKVEDVAKERDVDGGSAKKETTKSRKRSRTNSGKKSNASSQQKSISELPETITFSENDLSDVLDQVESLGQPQDQTTAKKAKKSSAASKKRKRRDEDGEKKATKNKDSNRDMDVFAFVSSPEDNDLLSSPRNKKGSIPPKPEKTSEELFDEIFSPARTAVPQSNTPVVSSAKSSVDTFSTPNATKTATSRSPTTVVSSCVDTATSSTRDNFQTLSARSYAPEVNSAANSAKPGTIKYPPDSGKSEVFTNAPKTNHIPISIPSNSIFARNPATPVQPSVQKSLPCQDRVERLTNSQLPYSAESLLSPTDISKPPHSHYQPPISSAQRQHVISNKESRFGMAQKPSHSQRDVQTSQHNVSQTPVSRGNDTLNNARHRMSDNVMAENQNQLLLSRPNTTDLSRNIHLPSSQSADFSVSRNQSSFSAGQTSSNSLPNRQQGSGLPNREQLTMAREQKKITNNSAVPGSEQGSRSHFYSAENFVRQRPQLERPTFDNASGTTRSTGSKNSEHSKPTGVPGQDRFSYAAMSQPSDTVGTSFIPSFGQQPSSSSIAPPNDSFLSPMNQSPVVTTTTSTFTFSLTGTTTSANSGHYSNPATSHHQFPFYPLHPSLSSSSSVAPVSSAPPIQSSNATPSLNLPFSLPPERPDPPLEVTNQGRFSSEIDFSASTLGNNPKSNYHRGSAPMKKRQEDPSQPLPPSQRPRSRQRPSSVNRSPQVSHGVDNFLNQPGYSSESVPQITSPPLHHPPQRREMSDRHPSSVSQSPFAHSPQNFGSPTASFSSPSYNPPPLQHSRSSSSSGSVQTSNTNFMNAAREKPSSGEAPQKKSKQSSSRSKPSQAIPAKPRNSTPSAKQYEIDTNLSHSIFDQGNSNFFPMQSHSPPSSGRNDAPTYLPPGNFFGVPSRPMSNSSSHIQHKTPENPFNPLFNPGRSQNGLGLNFQPPPGFHINHTMPTGHSNPGIPPPPHSTPISVMPNFSLGNLFGEPPADSMNISPIKFPHGNHMLPPQAGMDHNPLQHQPGAIYHNRPHAAPSSVMHSAMSINSLLGHGPHGFDARTMGPPMNGAMGPAFHGHGHPPSFGMPTLNFHNT